MTNNDKIQFNDSQKTVIEHMDGPCLVVAVPGSGKTATLTERVSRLVEKGVDARSILCMTFTNKAAKEMKLRITSRLGGEQEGMYVGTFHALCALMLRAYGERLGYTADFTIMDTNDQKDLLKKIAGVMDIDLKKTGINLYNLASIINKSREAYETETQLSQILQDPLEWAIAKRYLSELKRYNAIDFSGLLYETIRLLQENPDLVDKMHRRFKYIQVDEVQDTNYAQFLFINLIEGDAKNVLMVGDLSQCVSGDTKIITEHGEKNIRDIVVGDQVLCGSGKGRSLFSRVSSVYPARRIGDKPSVKIRTKNGSELLMTLEHTCFADFVNAGEAIHFVYLMYREGFGYRLGTSRTYDHKSNGRGVGFKSRLAGETADKVWVVRVEDSEKDARFWEHFLSVKYGISTWTFRVHSSSDNSYSSDDIKRMFEMTDSESGANTLMADYHIDESNPHHIPRAISSKRKRNMTITLCGDGRSKSLHTYAVSGSSESDSKSLSEAGLNVRKGKTDDSWRVEGARSRFEDVYSIYEQVNSALGVEVKLCARLTDISLPFVPACNLRKGMVTFVYDPASDSVVEDEIVSVEYIESCSDFYDIDVDRYHNFVGNGIVTHNSIYGFRGARYQNIVDFLSQHPSCKRIPLTFNYRSTPQIVKCADTLIRHNKSHMADNFETPNPDGEDVRVRNFINPRAESEDIARKIRYYIDQEGWDPGDIAIFYRINSMSRELETVFSRMRVPYTVIGGLSFYDRKEIRDALAMLKLLHNPSDAIAFGRCAGLFDGVGHKTVQAIEDLAREKGITILDACNRIEELSNRKPIINGAKRFAKVFGFDAKDKGPGGCLDVILQEFDYDNHLKRKSRDERDYETRRDNIAELLTSAYTFERESGTNISKYLQNLALVSAADKDGEETTVSLMTVHAAKGLEFPIVFVVGVEDALMPHARGIEEAGGDKVKVQEAVEEERRVCYVAMTRAKKHLHMSYCLTRPLARGRNVQPVHAFPSRFLVDAGFKVESRKRF